MDTNQIQSMDDLREAMNSPEVQEANRELSKRFLKNNRPKSLAVVVFATAAALTLLALSGHKASNVTPVSLRTAETVELCLEDRVCARLSDAQRDALVELLDSVKVKRLTEATVAPDQEVCTITAGEDQFTLTSGGQLLTADNAYACTSPAPEEIWAQLTALVSP